VGQYMEIGTIVNTHGVKGEFKVIPSTDDVTRYELLDNVLVEVGDELIEFPIESVRYFKQFVLLKLKGIDDMTKAERFKTYVLKIPRELALPLDDNEYYIGDLYNMKVVTEDGEDLGEIVDILFTAANDVYVVKDSSSSSSKEILIPAIKDCIKDVNLKENIMTVHLLEGLREL